MSKISQNITQIRQHIQELADFSKQDQTPLLIAVSKHFPAVAIREAYAAGQTEFAENYVQELLTKSQELAELNLTWHFIGQIQSNKTKIIAANASWVHTLTKLSHAKRLYEQRPAHLPALKILIEVKINPDPTKHGLENYAEILALASEIRQLDRLELKGLMGMASESHDPQLIQAQFKQLQVHLHRLNQDDFPLVNQLSIGMSQDYPQAIACGASMLRISSKIFGART